MEKNEFEKVANRVSFVTIVGNVALSVVKLLAGIIAHSNAMISDAIHSASDVFSTFVVLIGIKLSSKEADKEHPYGHERLECVAAILLSVILFITGLGIGAEAVKNILKGNQGDIVVPGTLALVAAIVSIVSKEAMYWYTRYHAKKIDSSALMADAWHHRSDAFSSIGALIGIGGARLGFPVMDSIASLVIFLFIAKAAFDIFMDAMDKMVDHSCDEETQNQLYECVMEHENVRGIDLLQTRIFGNKIYVDVEIQADGSCTLQEAHNIAEEVHNHIELKFPKVKHIMVHVNPAPEEMRMLFEIDTKDYDINGTTCSRPSARGIIIKDGKVAMIHSLKYDYYKFPGGGIEAGEDRRSALMREVLEESGLVVIPQSIQEYGMVHRIQKGDYEDVFIQDNYYYLCEVEDSLKPQKLDEYEEDEKFTLEYVGPQQVVDTNRACKHKDADQIMLQREIRVIELLRKEGHL